MSEVRSADGNEGHPFMVVGVGASAGGYEAFRELLESLPKGQTGFAVVFVQHLDPAHETMLPALLSRVTPMRVLQVEDGTALAPDTVYVAPPKSKVLLRDGVLLVQPVDTTVERHRTIDVFLESLAADRHERAVGVLLSGTASDGVNGLKAIKAEGGMTIVQDESTARFTSMPRAAVLAGVADLALTPPEIARELLRIRDHVPTVAPEPAKLPDADLEAIRRILARVWSVSSVDFSSYKQTTLKRRIMRRIVLNKLGSFEEYLKFLERDPAEAQSLYQDLVISVTSFFRDPEIFELLKSDLLPRLVHGKPEHAPIRIWVPGCSSGEEVYSLVIALLEYLGERTQSTPIQVFGTDISEGAIERARAGIYPEAIEADVSAERLRRFFQKRDAGYQIAKPVRDLCVFARQNVFKDPPFSNLDLISCRNVLIYFGPELQKRVLPMFHYALNATGYLILGSSESIGAYADYFAPAHPRYKIFAKRSMPQGPPLPFARVDPGFDRRPQLLPMRENTAHAFDPQREADRFLLDRYGPPSVLVNDDMNILQFRGRTGPFLEPAPGVASFNLLRMAREGLIVALHTAVTEAATRNAAVRREGVQFNGSQGPARTDLQVLPILGPGERKERFFLVLFENYRPASEASGEAGTEPPAAVALDTGSLEHDESLALRQELAATKDFLQSVVESQESFNEELRSANEEILSANEELQSTNEELETAKEELQSANEELTTLNEELQTRNEALAKANDDLNNLLNSINVAVVILDSDLRVRRFTTMAERLMNLIPTDVGRPFAHINPRIVMPDVAEMLRDVVEKLATREIEVRDFDGHWYNLRIRPYRTVENRIDGALLALLDIDSMKRSAARARHLLEYEQAMAELVQQPLAVLDDELRVQHANPAFFEACGQTADDTQGRALFELADGAFAEPGLRELLGRAPVGTVRSARLQISLPGKGRRTLDVNVKRLEAPEGGGETVLLGINGL